MLLCGLRHRWQPYSFLDSLEVKSRKSPGETDEPEIKLMANDKLLSSSHSVAKDLLSMRTDAVSVSHQQGRSENGSKVQFPKLATGHNGNEWRLFGIQWQQHGCIVKTEQQPNYSVEKWSH